MELNKLNDNDGAKSSKKEIHWKLTRNSRQSSHQNSHQNSRTKFVPKSTTKSTPNRHQNAKDFAEQNFHEYRFS